MVDQAEKDEAKAETEGDVEVKQGLSTKKIIILAVVLASLLSGGVVGLTMYLIGDSSSDPVVAQKEGEDGDQEEETENYDEEDEANIIEGPVQYHRMDPKFVVSFRDQKYARYMQFSLQVMTHDKAVIEQLKIHNPAIRSNLLLLFDSQKAEVINTREGKQQLLALITEDINKSLDELAGTSGIEASYFDSFVLQ